MYQQKKNAVQLVQQKGRIVMDAYIKQILSYLGYITDTYHWQITIHDFHHITGRFAPLFAPYHIHSNPFCIQLKNTREVWDTCICRQADLLNKLHAPIQFGMCHCGVEEYILPITYKEKKIGFVSVSGYRQNADLALQKLSHASDKFQLNFSQLKQLYFEYLNPTIPDQEFVFTLMAPLITMLEYLYVKQQELYQPFDMEAHGESSVYLKALLYMERYYREPVTLSRLCAFCHCSCSYMSHIFKQRTGKNINQYRNQLRINEAKTLLRSTSLSITDIALSLGFSSPNYFSKVFFSQCGCTPTQYKNGADTAP